MLNAAGRMLLVVALLVVQQKSSVTLLAPAELQSDGTCSGDSCQKEYCQQADGALCTCFLRSSMCWQNDIAKLKLDNDTLKKHNKELRRQSMDAAPTPKQVGIHPEPSTDRIA